MELRGNKICIDFANKPNSDGRMNRGKTKKLVTASVGLPFRNLLAILKMRIKDINRATKDTCTTEIIATSAGATEEFDGSKAIEFWSVIIEPAGIRERKGPEFGIIFVGPMNLEMK